MGGTLRGIGGTLPAPRRMGGASYGLLQLRGAPHRCGTVQGAPDTRRGRAGAVPRRGGWQHARVPAPPSTYLDVDRAAWAALEGSTAWLREDEPGRLAGLGDVLDGGEVDEVYRPLVRLLLLQAGQRVRARAEVRRFLGAPVGPAPFVVALAGSVAVGKSTTARVLRELLARELGEREVALVPTDGFLLPNAELERRGLLQRKGWPESYDTAALLRFLAAVTAGEAEVPVPVYSHVAYDVLAGRSEVVRRPQVLIVEGLNVLQPAPLDGAGRVRTVASDFFDTSIYLHAGADDLARWYVERFLALRRSAFADPASYFHRYAELPDDAARSTAGRIWRKINLPNLQRNILPTRARAAIVLEKGRDHRVRRVRLRVP